MKKLQIALDLLSVEKALEILDQIHEYIDIIEIGTPLMISEGSNAVRQIKRKFPEKIVFADIKVMDGGSIIPKIAFEAGADMVSVLAVADDHTIEATIACAKEYAGKVLVDMCSVPDMTARGKEIDAMGADYVCVHVGYDVQAMGIDPVEELKRIATMKTEKAIAGGIRLETFRDAVQSEADVIIVGGGLYNQPDIVATARKMRAILDETNNRK